MIVFDAVRLSGLEDVDLPILGVKVTDPFQVTAIDGLGPPEMEVQLAETHEPGGIFVNRRAPGRQIVVRVGLNPDYKLGQTVGDLRYHLYGLISPRVTPANQSIEISLLLRNVPVLRTFGYVKRIEIVPFSQTPEAQITIDCLGPYLESPEVETLIPDTNTWEINNVGLAPTGIKFTIQLLQPMETWTLELLPTGSMVFDFSDIDAGWWGTNLYLDVDTNEATRFVGLRYESKYERYMEVLTGDSDWLKLYGGVHQFTTPALGDFVWTHFEYRPRYWGI